jgi:nucleoside-triphosphatase THEP1
MMSYAILIYGPIGSGKTEACLRLKEKLLGEGAEIGGVVSPRVFQDGELIGYDCLDAASGESFPLVRLRDTTKDRDWFEFGGMKYAFSRQGFERANEILMRSILKPRRNLIIFVDEFGRLERAGLGFYTGAERVAEALEKRGIAIYTCRSDLIEAVEELVRGKVKVICKYDSADFKAIYGKMETCLHARG